MQHEIKGAELLLKEDGGLREPGFAKKLLPVYRRSDIKANPLRIKEWDYYLVNNEHYAVALTVADNSYMGLDSISFLWLDEGRERTVSRMQLMTRGSKKLPSSSAAGDVTAEGKDYKISFRHDGGRRILEFRMEQFADKQPIHGTLVLTDEPEESMVIATPFHKKTHFYYNQKINCMRVQGKVNVLGKDYEFYPEDTFAVLDWGRGVWTYKNTWYWGSASGQVDGKAFGFNLGYGFGDTLAATENMLFYEGKAHKLHNIHFNIPLRNDGKEDYLKPWTITSDDGRFEMDFIPVLDRAACTSLLVLESDQHQVFGRFTGKAVLDDGTVINIENLTGFAEKVMNKW
ncbi:MAG TPA: DUF2804 domain-containing protein [Clostridiales bacterium]|nr:DUF2804 domain-containing protein [Clostridiales bacterium]